MTEQVFVHESTMDCWCQPQLIADWGDRQDIAHHAVVGEVHEITQPPQVSSTRQ